MFVILKGARLWGWSARWKSFAFLSSPRHAFQPSVWQKDRYRKSAAVLVVPQCQWKCQTPLSIIFSGRSPWWKLVYRLYLHWPMFSSGFSSPPVSYLQLVLPGTDLSGLVWWPENRLLFQSRIHSHRLSLWLLGKKGGTRVTESIIVWIFNVYKLNEMDLFDTVKMIFYRNS